ncbi:unnamed protein product [Lactuca virosa]|uniref:Uncharacterized protein n=1 Tax=Lactuca virosa TaxID=75947 RepID=A0AAU9LUE5_9ASTR|nr:unnamed protein product [Lactuca virosa]
MHHPLLLSPSHLSLTRLTLLEKESKNPTTFVLPMSSSAASYLTMTSSVNGSDIRGIKIFHFLILCLCFLGIFWDPCATWTVNLKLGFEVFLDLKSKRNTR